MGPSATIVEDFEFLKDDIPFLYGLTKVWF